MMTMIEPKPLASLSSSLLARKGAARPAMRRQLVQGGGLSAAPLHDDLGWNDMGYDVDPDPDTPMDYEHDAGYNPLANAVPEVKPEVKQQQDRIAEQLQVQAEELGVSELQEPAAPVVAIQPRREIKAAAPRTRAAPGSKGKAAFTLRLDHDRHLKLRLACAISNKSAQQLVTAALDAFIEAMPEIAALAAQVPSKKQA